MATGAAAARALPVVAAAAVAAAASSARPPACWPSLSASLSLALAPSLSLTPSLALGLPVSLLAWLPAPLARAPSRRTDSKVAAACVEERVEAGEMGGDDDATEGSL